MTTTSTTGAVPTPPELRPVLHLGAVHTLPNHVTLARTGLAVLLGCTGIATGEVPLLVLAYVAYWVGDVADGWLARRLGQETLVGAVLDVVCDRVCTTLLLAGLITLLPAGTPVAVVFLMSFAVVDTMLSLAFLAWPLQTPNEFWRVDPVVHAWNWSPLAKGLNSAAVVLALVLGQIGVALVLAVGVLGIKIWSAARVIRLLS